MNARWWSTILLLAVLAGLLLLTPSGSRLIRDAMGGLSSVQPDGAHDAARPNVPPDDQGLGGLVVKPSR